MCESSRAITDRKLRGIGSRYINTLVFGWKKIPIYRLVATFNEVIWLNWDICLLDYFLMTESSFTGAKSISSHFYVTNSAEIVLPIFFFVFSSKAARHNQSGKRYRRANTRSSKTSPSKQNHFPFPTGKSLLIRVDWIAKRHLVLDLPSSAGSKRLIPATNSRDVLGDESDKRVRCFDSNWAGGGGSRRKVDTQQGWCAIDDWFIVFHWSRPSECGCRRMVA